MLKQTFFFYDLETSGLNPREDRIMQFAGQRTDAELSPIGEPVNLLVKLSDDTLPSPTAIAVTGITPQSTLMDGISEPEFARFVIEEVFVPNTIALGFNTIRFDDEFMRHTLWRNFYDPYEWQWKDGRSRWDILDLVRITRALRPEGINWPVTDDGKPTNRLELITKLNNISHEHAHDALADVYATIAVAKLIKEKQPDLFDYLLKLRDKNLVKKLINLDDKKPFIYASGRYGSACNFATVAFPLAPAPNGNVLVCDLRNNWKEFFEGNPQLRRGLSDEARDDGPEERPEKNLFPVIKSIFPVIKTLCYNKCPAVAPLGVLDKADGWQKLNLTPEQVQENIDIILQHPEFAEQVRTDYENRPEFPPAIDPESALYDGFLGDHDRIRCNAVRNAKPNELADFHPDFADERLPELLLHYKAKNFPGTLTEFETKKWQDYRYARLNRQSPKFIEELNKIAEQNDFIADELKLYYESLFDADY